MSDTPIIGDVCGDLDLHPRDLRFTAEESDRAMSEWKAYCGPHALAAACGKSLAGVRSVLPASFPGWMNPTAIERALAALGVRPQVTKGLKTQDLRSGIARIQFEGDFLKPGVPARVAYQHTHWIAVSDTCVFCTMMPHFGWFPDFIWKHQIGREIKGRYSGWHVTHAYEFPTKD